MKIFGEIELHTLDKQVVECQLVELSIIYDMYRAHYRVKSDDYNIVLFFDKYGQVTDDNTEYFVDFDVCENYRIRKCIMSGIGKFPCKEHLCRCIEDALTNRALPTVNDEIDEVRRVICAFIPQLDIEVAQKIARKIVRAIYNEVN